MSARREPDADDIAKALAAQSDKTPNLPLLQAMIQLIDHGDNPTRALLDGFLAACDQITSMNDVAARALALAPTPPIHVTLEAPAKMWFTAAPHYESAFDGYLWAGEEALNYSTLRLFASEKKAREEAAKGARECLRADLENDTLWQSCARDLVDQLDEERTTRLKVILHDDDDDNDNDLFRAPFRTLTDADCDEVLELLPHLKWLVETIDFDRGSL